ncbi:MAG: hypothetical protein ACI9N9_002434 [Enterobacterales bacterium]|jgi:hypothetical protein
MSIKLQYIDILYLHVDGISILSKHVEIIGVYKHEMATRTTLQ